MHIITIVPNSLTGVAIYDTVENSLSSYADFDDLDTAQQWIKNRLEKEFVFLPSCKMIVNTTDEKHWMDWWWFSEMENVDITRTKRLDFDPSTFSQTGIRNVSPAIRKAVTLALEYHS